MHLKQAPSTPNRTQEKHKITIGKSFKCPPPAENGRNPEGPEHVSVHIPAAEG